MTSQITSLQPVGGAFLIENVAPDSIFIPEFSTLPLNVQVVLST